MDEHRSRSSPRINGSEGDSRVSTADEIIFRGHDARNHLSAVVKTRAVMKGKRG